VRLIQNVARPVSISRLRMKTGRVWGIGCVSATPILMFLKMSDGGSLYGYNLYVQMPISRTADKTAPMYMPDDAIEAVFNNVVAKISQRYQIPQDTVKDNLPPGNKSS